MQIQVFKDADPSTHVSGLSDLLHNAVENGALVGHVLPLDRKVAEDYWRDVTVSTARGERVLICAISGDKLIGTVQLYLSPEANAPHRGEVYKLLVCSSHRNRGVGQALMLELESQARKHGRSLLLLDTVQDGAGERLYRRLGWQDIGVVPNHFVDPWGGLKNSVYMMRFLDSGRSPAHV